MPYHVTMHSPRLGSWSTHAASCRKCNGHVPFTTEKAALAAGLGVARVVEPCDCTGLCTC